MMFIQNQATDHTPKRPLSHKKYLEQIENSFATKNFKDKPSSSFSFYPYANDIQQLAQGDFLKKFSIASQQSFFSLPSENFRKIALVIGNGYILSLLPDLPIEDVILADIEPAVHYFILFVRDLILNTNESNFNKTRDLIKHKINAYCQTIKSYKLLSEEDTLESEINALGDKHFLSSEARFNQCKQALLEKELLPIHLNILDYKAVNKFASLLREARLKVSFINITNMGDYDRFRILYHNLILLPLAEKFSVVSTSLISTSNRNDIYPKTCLIANNREQLEANLIYNYQRNLKV